MRRHVLLSVGLVTLVGGVVVGFQPPAPVPPGPPPPGPTDPTPRALPPSVTGTPPGVGPVAPAGATAPVPAARVAGPADPPLASFEPLAAFPVPTQLAVRSVLLGSGWLTRMSQTQGRFLYGFNPTLRQPMAGDHDLKQAQAALALAQAAKFCGDDRQAAVASQAILTLLAATRVDPADPTCRTPVHSSLTCNRVGFAATLALAIYELPAADDRLVAEAERLCGFLRKQLRPDGSVHYTDGADDVPTKADPAGGNEYPGFALHALAVGNRTRPAGWKLEAVGKGVAHYRAFFKTRPHPMLAATLTPAFAELYLQTKSADAAAAVFELNDWLADLQYPATDPRHAMWAGGFRGWADGRPVESAPGFECGAYLQSLACAYHLTRLAPDVTRAARYQTCVTDAAQFVTGLQYIEANTRHFENTFRANTLIGGFHLSADDGNLRVDASARSITGLLRFLSCGAERN